MIIECSKWLFPAIILSGYFSPFVLAVSCIADVLNYLLHLIC